jgi:hypothetical protein
METEMEMDKQYRAQEIAKEAARIGHDVYVSCLASHGIHFATTDLSLVCYPDGGDNFTLTIAPDWSSVVCCNAPTSAEPLVWKRHVRVYYTEGSKRERLHALFDGGKVEFDSIRNVQYWPTSLRNNGDEYYLFVY